MLVKMISDFTFLTIQPIQEKNILWIFGADRTKTVSREVSTPDGTF